MAGGRRSTTGNQHALARTTTYPTENRNSSTNKVVGQSLDQIRNELTTNSLAIAKCIQDITDRIDSISCILMDSNVKQGHTWDQLERCQNGELLQCTHKVCLTTFYRRIFRDWLPMCEKLLMKACFKFKVSDAFASNDEISD